jgi:hypothetical protein
LSIIVSQTFKYFQLGIKNYQWVLKNAHYFLIDSKLLSTRKKLQKYDFAQISTKTGTGTFVE